MSNQDEMTMAVSIGTDSIVTALDNVAVQINNVAGYLEESTEVLRGVYSMLEDVANDRERCSALNAIAKNIHDVGTLIDSSHMYELSQTFKEFNEHVTMTTFDESVTSSVDQMHETLKKLVVQLKKRSASSGVKPPAKKVRKAAASSK